MSLLLLRKVLWRSKSQSKLYSIVVLVDHDGVECVIRGVGRGRGEARRRAKAQVAARLAAAARESAGGSSAAHHVSIVFTPGFFLQAILYGSIRFWLFSLIIPAQIITWVEEDAYHLIWASNPELFSDEDGTKKKARAYITKPASYLPQKKGGGGLMHLKSHVQAFYAQWGRRYLHPSNPPWKSVADI